MFIIKKINIVKKNEDFSKIINTGSVLKHKDFSLYVIKTEEVNYRFGISVGKKLGNAVLRNKLRRQIKDILDQKQYHSNFDCIIMVRKSAVDKTYLELKMNLFEALNRIGIVKGDNNE